MKKKLMAIVLGTIMVISMVGCATKNTNEGSGSSTTTETATTETATTESETVTTEATTETATTEVAAVNLDKSWPAETVKIGVETYDTADDQFLAMQSYYEYLAESFNIEFIYSESLASAEDELKFVENCASAGAKAIIGYYNISEAEVVQLCVDKEMYYWGSANNTKITEKFADNKYYLGGYESGDVDYSAGYEMAKGLIAQGCEKLVYVSGGRDFGVPLFIARSEGFYAAVKEAQVDNTNIEIVYDVSGFPGTDSFTAGQAAVCDMEFDGIACSFTAAVWFQPLSTAGKLDSIKIATIGQVGDVYYDFVNSGTVSTLLYDPEEIYFGSAVPMILNAVDGSEASRNNGKYANFSVDRWVINTPEQYNAIYDLRTAGEYYVTAEDVANCLTHFNPEASYATLQEVYSDKTVENTVTK